MGSVRKTEDRRQKTEVIHPKPKGIQGTHFCLLSSVFCLTIFFSCGKTQLSVKDSRKTINLPSGKVEMFGRSNFLIEVPELEVNIYEVTNASFADFVKKTGYVTTAERNGEGMVFDLQRKEWILMPFADWQNPRGPKSTIYGRNADPVVQVSFEDACAYCDWLEMRLPYESEWEYIYQLDQNETMQKFNKWDGIFPLENHGEDGFKNTAPVGSFEPGSKGIYDLRGNVWEWTLDLFHPNWPNIDTAIIDPVYTGPMNINVGDCCIMANDSLRVTKGGSYLCAENYCKGYMDQKRQSADPKLSYEHIGFRCIRDLSKK